MWDTWRFQLWRTTLPEVSLDRDWIHGVNCQINTYYKMYVFDLILQNIDKIHQKMKGL